MLPGDKKMHVQQLRAARIISVLLCSIVPSVSNSVTAAATPTYEIVDIGSLGGGSSIGRAINNLGQIAGSSGVAWPDPWHAFLWTAGTMVDVSPPGGFAEAYGINDAGTVVGDAGPGAVYGFMWSEGQTTNLGTLGGYVTWARAINNQGRVTGASTSAPGNFTAIPFLYDAGAITALVGPSIMGWGFGINDQGVVAGAYSPFYFPSRAAIFSNGTVTDIHTWGANGWSVAYDINNLGHVTGAGGYQYEPVAAFVYRDGVTTSLELPGGRASIGRSINDNDEVVGHYDGIDWWSHAFVYTGGKAHDLQDLIDPQSPLQPYVRLTDALGINNSGWIVANGLDSRDETWSARCYLLRPLTVINLLQRLLANVTDVGPGSSLADKVKLAQAYHAASDEPATCSILVDLASQLSAQSGKKISAALASALIAQVGAISTAVGCN